MVKSNAGGPRDKGSIPGSGRSLGGGNGNILQYSCLGNPMDRGAWQATFMLRVYYMPRVVSIGNQVCSIC